MAIFVKVLRSYGVKTSQRANWHRPGALVLWMLNAQEVATDNMYRLPHAIYYISTVDGPCQTLRELVHALPRLPERSSLPTR